MNTLPAPFEDRMRKLLANEASDFFDVLQTVPPVSIRLNPGKPLPVEQLFPEEQFLSSVPWCESGFYLKSRPLFTLDPSLHSGAYYVQEASSMFLDHLLKHLLPDRPVKILDLCAAPGGKSSLLAARLPKDSLLVSNEVIRSRAAILKENLIKWGQADIVITNNDPSDFRPLEGAFDLIVVDAPCSGEGMFRKDPQSIREWSENNLQLCQERQRRILADIWPCLKTGGFLIYSTCTFNPEENEAILEYLLQTQDAQAVEIPFNFPGIVRGNSKNPCYRFYPHRIQGEGFFTGVLQKTEETNFKAGKNKKPNSSKTTILPEEIRQYIQHPEDFLPYRQEQILGIFPVRHEEFIQYLNKYLHILYQGCELAETIHGKSKLLPAAALWQGLDRSACSSFETDRNTALTFLKKEEIPAPEKHKEWLLITYRNQGLGWCKHLGNRLNNYYPKEWRIRMAIE